ncbi:MAG: PAS domain-containing protein, partial [Methanoregula sp.]|nr:PAS domain-containing protein [Methanoregula sp.]
DITDRKKAEETIHESEGRFRTLFEQSKDAVFVADPKTRMITDCNRKAELLTGYSRAELLTLKMDALHPKDVRAEAIDNFRKYADGMDASVDSIVITRDGQRVHVSILGNFIVVNNQNLLIASFRDMSRQKQAADTLALTARKLVLMNDVTYQYIQNKVTGLRGYADLSKDAKTEAVYRKGRTCPCRYPPSD